MDDPDLFFRAIWQLAQTHLSLRLAVNTMRPYSST